MNGENPTSRKPILSITFLFIRKQAPRAASTSKTSERRVFVGGIYPCGSLYGEFCADVLCFSVRINQFAANYSHVVFGFRQQPPFLLATGFELFRCRCLAAKNTVSCIFWWRKLFLCCFRLRSHSSCPMSRRQPKESSVLQTQQNHPCCRYPLQ